MNMELPKKYNRPFVKVEGGKLIIYKNVRYEDLMYELTYAIRKKRCIYCGKKLNSKNRTLDHRYPRDSGGVTITNNLFPCCAKCNSKKGNLTHEEFMKVKKLSKKEKKKFIKKLLIYKRNIYKKIGFKLPKKWITFLDFNSIKYQQPTYDFRGNNYNKILVFYSTYKKLSRPVIVDKNNKLLDGYNVLLVAKDMGINQIPSIRLDNVILMVKI